MLLDLLLPQRCVACARPGAQLCDGCRDRIRRLRPPFCERCGAPVAWPVKRCRECDGRRLAFAQARAAVAYDEVIRAVVAAWKERALRGFVEIAADLVAEEVPAPDARVVTFVPADPDRRLKRWHHPSEALANELGRRWEVPVAAFLRRIRAAPRQRGLDLASRRANVRGAFAASQAPTRVCLVDDVYTTGSTASAAASALRKAGARRVDVVTFARAIRVR
jgi:predicted amidophosphoribosyltransferase